MRNSFINQLTKEAEDNKKIFLLCGDLGYSVLEEFRDKYTDRFINIGVAEQNMIGIASGLAMDGYNVFVYSLANFPTLRALEQIRYDIAYPKRNVKIISIGSGFAYGPLGVSHHATEDISIMRAIPNILTCSPCDPNETKTLASLLSRYDGPAYIRINKNGEPIITSSNKPFKIGHISKLLSGERAAIFGTGAIIGSALHDAKKMNYSVYSFPFLNSINDKNLIQIINKYEKIITIEENQLCGGFGSMILEKINDYKNNKLIRSDITINRVGIEDQFITFSGTQDYLREKANLTIKHLL